MAKIGLFCQTNNSRIVYIVNQILSKWLGLEVILFDNPEEYLTARLPKINYSQNKIQPKEIFIPAHPFLEESTLEDFNPEFKSVEGLPAAFFPEFEILDPGDFKFDLFSLAFLLLSRYEEYLDRPRDHHRRFPATSSLAYLNNFLSQPLLDQWTLRLKEKLIQKFPGLSFLEWTYTFLPTFDVDYAWAYLHKSPIRTLTGFIKSLLKADSQSVINRARVLSGKKNDPFFTFPDLETLHKTLEISPIFFFHIGNWGRFDRGISWKNIELQKLIKETASQYSIGLHPSYRSHKSANQLRQELVRLEGICSTKIVYSRQHYLLLELPNTYKDLLDMGILHDFTMGYADMPGFRASTSRSFTWYDLPNEQETLLNVHPFQAMDVTLKDRLKLNPGEVPGVLEPIITEIKQVQGTFCLLWHNSSLSGTEGWQGWENTYEDILSMAINE